jgi:HEAT repeat protein
MSSHSFLARVRAAEALGALGGDDARDALLRGLHDDEALVRIASAHALVRTSATDVLRPIVDALASPDDEAARGALAEALLDAGPPAVDELLAALRDDTLGPRVRWLIVVVLGELRAIPAVADLLACLESEDDELRARAAHALGKIGDPRAVPALDAIAADGGPWQVRTAASAALGALGDPTAVGGLLRALAAEEWAVRDAAARSLTELGEPAVEAVAAQAAELPPGAVAHFWGRLDVGWRTDALVDRAAEGDELAGRLVRAAVAGGATARMEERAGAEDRAARWARDELPTEATP